jgi:hypothetical protein
MDCIPRKETVKVIGDLITAWQLPFEIKSVVDNGQYQSGPNNSYTLEVEKTYYLVKGKRRFITIDSVRYEIIDVVDNTSITIIGSVLPPLITFNLPVPYYFNGTILQTNTEIAREKDLSKKTPMIFLRRPFDETIDAQDLNNTDVASVADLTFYFLTEASFADWLTAQHDVYAIKPMRNLMYEFIEMLKKNEKYIKRMTNYTATDLIKFGIVTQKGVESGGLFSNNYSGVQMDISLGIKYQCFCN